ncbi:hypothetical protein [Streptomyces sp. NPDC097610]|uniref:hypothetical protein n=1 Tax=Streptomyces sp. NPDC097610 TaxID=3157227 RepID=UPI00331F970F
MTEKLPEKDVRSDSQKGADAQAISDVIDSYMPREDTNKEVRPHLEGPEKKRDWNKVAQTEPEKSTEVDQTREVTPQPQQTSAQRFAPVRPNPELNPDTSYMNPRPAPQPPLPPSRFSFDEAKEGSNFLSELGRSILHSGSARDGVPRNGVGDHRAGVRGRVPGACIR